MKNLIKIYILTMILISTSNANYTISPLKLEFKDNEKVISATLTNDSDEEKYFQVAIVKIAENKGKEEVRTSRDLMVTPVTFQIQPHKQQLIRVARKDLTSNLEDSYELDIKELPRNKKGDNVVHLVTRFSVPVSLGSGSKGHDKN